MQINTSGLEKRESNDATSHVFINIIIKQNDEKVIINFLVSSWGCNWCPSIHLDTSLNTV